MHKQIFRRRTLVRAASFLLAAFVVVGGLALQARARAEAYRLYLENGYRHAFAELSANLNELDVALQKGIYATSPSMLGVLCTQIYGKAMSAQMALGELPYSNVELEQTAAFLAKAGDYAAALSRSASVTGVCSDEQREALRGLSAGASDLSARVAGLQSDLMGGAVTLEDLEAAEARLSAAEGSGHTLADSSYQTVESDFPELPSLIYDGPFSEHIAGRTPAMLEGREDVTQDEARLAAARFLDLKPELFTLVSAGSGRLPTYSFSAMVDGGELYVEVTRRGGLVVELLHSRPVESAALSREEAVAAAAAFLTSRGYPNMTESYFIDQGNVLTINFAAQQGEVLCYPDLVKVSVALDNGRVVGFESEGYLMNHTLRDLPRSPVSLGKAQAALSPELDILSHRLALIPTGGEYEVLTHEFKCQSADGRHVLVYINAQTGQEEKILILLEDESGTLVI
ncbi:germination protein YpeB [Intestinimonas massiliensis]|jgi:spore germination protein|uniref:Germination protein YpeB n=1 Tax=Intestinimonas massiliensis (ex Afouda et al. 2020) TaxID=1673721 RepID=A0ABS9M5U9_9FIRM|nr:germination protein YpeB [Intestinimonas massiliensis (ex Afouda et al. 2020)]MCG4526170.1 germination protein YpeB [Intestinimonas massiliensis (ex Afouda et al. 2020)]MCQ4805893.1 germination protein YpeB [Intestinimonas massiliensis (ex Afouda et al. 2020)]